MEGALKIFEAEISKIKEQLKKISKTMKKNQNQQERDLMAQYLNKIISVEFLSGDKMDGKLVRFDKYNILFEASEGNTLLIPKHSIKHLCEKK